MEEKNCITEDKVYLTVKEVSEYLKIKIKTLYAMASAGEIPHYRIGRLLRFKKQDVDAWIETKKVTAPSHQPSKKMPARKKISDVYRIISDVVDAANGKRYNSSGKSGHVKDLGKEVKDGTV